MQYRGRYGIIEGGVCKGSYAEAMQQPIMWGNFFTYVFSVQEELSLHFIYKSQLAIHSASDTPLAIHCTSDTPVGYTYTISTKHVLR